MIFLQTDFTLTYYLLIGLLVIALGYVFLSTALAKVKKSNDISLGKKL